MRPLPLLLLACAALLAGCDQLGIESPEAANVRREAEGKAVGGACRHAGRAIEDCYVLNKKADKAAVFAGWRDMNDYMRENKIDAVKPELPPPALAAASAAAARAAAASAAEAGEEHTAKDSGHGEKKAAHGG
ncbi:hypothetical protein BurJ1DRAFT_4292 [Burkholderiales bacterium JOSHI_001]|nr:hypothetical protein BurJ1DRAFT_4292 [Burkholderiales bacterium JOSHI_001]